MYENSEGLYVLLADGYCPVCLKVIEGGMEITTLGSPEKKRPVGAVRTTKDAVIARHNLSVGDSYPVSTEASVPDSKDESAEMSDFDSFVSHSQRRRRS